MGRFHYSIEWTGDPPPGATADEAIEAALVGLRDQIDRVRRSGNTDTIRVEIDDGENPDESEAVRWRKP